jgi:hypothetical protein
MHGQKNIKLWTPIFIYGSVALNSSWNKKCLKKVAKNIKPRFMIKIFFFENHAACEIMWKIL